MSNEVNDQPPAYSDDIRGELVWASLRLDSSHPSPEPPKDVKTPQAPPAMNPGPSYVAYAGSSSSPTPVVYHYDNPLTGEHLPPSHPEMICLQAGEHVPHTKYGLLGILAAVFWFPLGVGLCLLDRRVKCSRCGRTIEDGICS
ncbi:hypothetical protein B0H12DRAFT_63225 [Mycena haematopus]|nr:hypothetical protein B0H12DRAFT_63225 [Mycena haematopus]